MVMIRSLIRLLSRMELLQKALLRQRMPPRPVTLQRAPAEPVRPKGLTRQGPRETRPESRHLREMSLSQALRLRPELQELRQLMQPEPMLPLAQTGPRRALMAALLMALLGALLWSSLQESTSPGRQSSSFL